MGRTVATLTVFTVTFLAISQGAGLAQDRLEAGRPATESPVVVTNPLLQASLQRISEGSALWRDALESVRKTGRRAIVVTPAEAAMFQAEGPNDREFFHPGLLAEAMPVGIDGRQVAAVVVVVNLPLVKQVHDARLSVPREFEADLDRILVHEIYGHAVPYLLAGDRSGRCSDPRRGERAADSCSIRRENAVRAELGLGYRGDDGVSSLRLARGRSH